MSRIKIDKQIVKYRVEKPEAEKPEPERASKDGRKGSPANLVLLPAMNEKVERPEVLIGSKPRSPGVK